MQRTQRPIAARLARANPTTVFLVTLAARYWSRSSPRAWSAGCSLLLALAARVGRAAGDHLGGADRRTTRVIRLSMLDPAGHRRAWSSA